jgi:hypothetical protein
LSSHPSDKRGRGWRLFCVAWSNTDAITKWLQVLALAIAGYWTYNNFNLGEADSLKTNASVVGTLASESIPDNEGCYLKFQVTVENAGKRAFTLDKIRIRAWRTDIPPIIQNAFRYFEVDKLQEAGPLIDSSFQGGNLVRSYLPQNSASQTFTWTMPPVARAIFLFRADAESKGVSLSYGRQWLEDICVSSAKKGLK